MNRKELVNYINKLEEDFPVEDWKINGVRIWPLIKLELFFKYLWAFIEPEKGGQKVKKIAWQKLLGAITSYIYYLRVKNKSSQGPGILFLSAPAYFSMLNGKYLNRFYHPIIDQLPNSYQHLHVSYAAEYDGDYQYAEKTIFFGRVLPFFILKKKFKKLFGVKSPNTHQLENLEAFYGNLDIEMQNLFSNFHNFKRIVLDRFETIELTKLFWHNLLIKNNIKLVVELCYYSTPCYGVNLVTRELGIPSLEIMHGGMGNQHLAYSGWERKIPLEGYALLPKIIWVWDKQSESLLATWMKCQEFHSSLVGGFPWLDYLRKEKENQFQMPADKKIIIYTLQFEFIEEYIYHAIELSEPGYEWWLRMHPRKIYARESIVEELNKRGIMHKVNIDEANSFPLPIILDACFCHISAFSGSIIEASIINKPTIIVSNTGAEAYYQYVESGICKVFLDKDGQGLVQLIDSLGFEHSDVTEKSVDYKRILERYI